MPITKLTPENNYPYLQERLKALQQAVPEAFADGKINWDTLREVLGDNLEDEGRDEYFGLNWPGKREARKRTATPSRATLVPAPGEGVNEDTTENLFIEGDNLEVLKLLQKSYAGKIKMIYIDPPYNTGNDFIYNDNFTDPLEAYLDYTGARGESGELLTTNTRADGRFHSKWLNMMYPRLILARQLLREDGVIFISIDDNEVHHLRQMMSEIFGEENFVCELVWKKKYTGGKHATHYVDFHEYILVASKNKTQIGEILMERPDEEKGKFELEDEYINERGRYYIRPLKSNLEERPTLVYPIELPDGTTVETQWLVSRATFNVLVIEGRILIKKLNNGNYQVYKKYYENDGEGMVKVPSIIDGIYNTEAKIELKELFEIEEGRDNVFYTVKPTNLLKYLLRPFSTGNEIVMDFFSGAASTAQAIIDMNIEDNGKRKFVMVQLPEKTLNPDYSTISEIGKERIRRVIKGIEVKKRGETNKAPLLDYNQPQIDLGFKVFKYNHSNFKQWKPQQDENAEVITSLFDNLSDPLIQGWKKEDLLSEVLLLEGFPLTSEVTYLEELLKNQVYRMSAPDFCAHNLFVCLDETVQPVTIDLLTMGKEDIFICLDSALSDELKARVQDKFNVHVI